MLISYFFQSFTLSINRELKDESFKTKKKIAFITSVDKTSKVVATSAMLDAQH